MDYNKYIGLPYKDNGRDETGVDCWGLARLFYKQELNIDLPSYADLYTTSYDPAVSQAINAHKDNWELTTSAKPGDLCLFNIYGEPAHVGIYVGSRKFLHAREGRDSVIESLDSPQWFKRFQGFYKHSTNETIQVVGAPHPLRTGVVHDWIVEGTTVKDFVNFVNEKYKVSKYLSSRLVVVVDGILIPQDKWDTVTISRGQTIAYKTVAEGRNATRMLLTLAVFAVAGPIAGQLTGYTSAASAAALMGGQVTLGLTMTNIAATMAIQMAGMALVNAIAPARPQTQSDPGSAKSLDLFSGSSNQANRFGAIPVVLGKMRVTGLHGATPYIDTLTDTSIINMIIVWGIGPLKVTDICVGANPIKDYYDNNFAQNIPAPITLTGYANESDTQFNQLYPSDVETSSISPIELVNNTEQGNPWRYAPLTTPANEIAIALTFPEGMRQLVTSGDGAGDVRDAAATVEVQVRKYLTNPDVDGEAWGDALPYFNGQYTTSASSNTPGYTAVLGGQSIDYYDSENGASKQELYRWYVFCLVPGGSIVRLDGAATENADSEPSAGLLAEYKKGAYASLTGTDNDPNTYKRMPIIPASYVPMYALCIRAGVVVEQIDYLQDYGQVGLPGYSGLGLTLTPNTVSTADSEGGYYSTTVSTTVTIASGYVTKQYGSQPQQGVAEQVFVSSELIGGTVIHPTNYKDWSELLRTHAVWTTQTLSTTDTFTATKQSVVFKYSGYYNVEASADDEGGVYIDNSPAVLISKPGWRTTVSNLVYITAGTYPVRVTAKNSGAGLAGIACKITYTANGGLNNLANPNTILAFGTPGFYNKRKDAFNFIYRIKNLPLAKYQVRVRRNNSDEVEPADNLRNYHKVSLYSVTGFNTSQPPLKALPNNTYLAKTAIRLQSTNKANGNIDGINAIVQTICDDWNSTANKWEPGKTTSNPASLFLYVITHPANAYRVEYSDRYSKIDMIALQQWHEFCEAKNLRYNAVVSSTQSVLDTLRDIAAAGLASPNFVDGKWTIVVDKPRDYVTQHFTPHNSWGFEAVKLLPRLPDAFRVTFSNEDKAYQPDETIIYNYPKNISTAKVFEELNLPGVTNLAQAEFLAKWHLAQLKLRPERYTINTDFEYLVCNRGDLVRVTHDVPLWGLSSGRITNISGSILKLSEQVYLQQGQTYQIRVRYNTPTTTTGTENSTVKTFTVSSTGMYDTINVGSIITADKIEIDNLYMLGKVSPTESQELIVLSIEPTSNTAARITLMDYSGSGNTNNIYTYDFDQFTTYNTNISLNSSNVVNSTVTKAPIIDKITSDSAISEAIAGGTYQNVTIVSFVSQSGLTAEATRIQLEVQLGNAEFNNETLAATHTVNKEAGSITVTGLKTLTMYKFRARYTNATGSVVGPWSIVYYHTVNGKTDSFSNSPGIVLDLENIYITATPSDTFKSADFITYEFRMVKGTGIEDFWDLDTTVSANGIKVVQSRTQGRFDLTKITDAISEAGVSYKIACRGLDISGNYSKTSTIGNIVIETIR